MKGTAKTYVLPAFAKNIPQMGRFMFQSVPYKRNSYKKGTLVPETVLKDDGLKFISAKQGFSHSYLIP